MKKDARIFVAGHRGLVGSAICRVLTRQGYTNILTKARQELDLLDFATVERFFAEERPEFCFLAAARVGGIQANLAYPAEFLRENLLIQNNVMEAARSHGVERLLFLASSAIYPKDAPQPISESHLLTGVLDGANRPYAMAKIAGIEMCWSYNRQYGTQYLVAAPSNLYGPGDHFDPAHSHVLASLLRKAAVAKVHGERELVVWGTGTPRRELMYSDDAAEGCVFLMNLEEERFETLLRAEAPPLINLGTGEDVTIRELAELVARVVGFDGTLVFDTTKPDGVARKLMDVARLHALGWRHGVSLEQGVAATWEASQAELLQGA